MMHHFSYHRPASLAEAWQLRAQHEGACFVAGGTDLLVQVKSGLAKPPALISLRHIDELRRVETHQGGLRIGAAVPLAEVMRHPLVRDRAPLLADAVATMGSEQIRSSATLGGNLCNGSPCADSAPPLFVLDARAEIAGPAGRRQIPIRELLTGPKQTALSEGEILTALWLPAPPADARGAFFKRTRVSMDLALVNLAALLRMGKDGRCLQARLCAGAVGPTPLGLDQVEAELAGATLGDETIAAARALACESVEPIDDIRASAAYRRHLVGVLVERALRALGGSGGAP